MRQIQLGLPSATGGGTIPSSPPLPASNNIKSAGTSSSSDSGPYIPQPAGGSAGAEESEGAESKDDAGSTPPTLQIVKSKKSAEPTTGINLSGCFENWGVASSQSLEVAKIEFSGLTAQQVRQILQRIPSNYKATLEISYTEGGEQ